MIEETQRDRGTLRTLKLINTHPHRNLHTNIHSSQGKHRQNAGTAIVHPSTKQSTSHPVMSLGEERKSSSTLQHSQTLGTTPAKGSQAHAAPSI